MKTYFPKQITVYSKINNDDCQKQNKTKNIRIVVFFNIIFQISLDSYKCFRKNMFSKILSQKILKQGIYYFHS